MPQVGVVALPERSPNLRRTHEAFVSKLHRWDEHLRNAGLGSPPSDKADEALLALSPDPNAPPRVLVVYTYAHADWRLLNLAFFLRNGLVAASRDGTPVDYTFVFNGEAPLYVFQDLGLRYTIAKNVDMGFADKLGSSGGENEASRLGNVEGLPGQPLISIVLRENQGFDMCASKLVLERGWAARPGKYTLVVLMNASVRGPFMPSYASSAFTWVDAFISRLGGADGVRMVGTTINCLSSRRDAASGAFSSLHVQSMVLALDRPGLHAMHPMLRCYDEMLEAISHGEVGSTQAVLTAGYAVAALQSSWRGFAVRKDNLASDEVVRRCAAVLEDSGGDPVTPGAYLRGDVHPYEVIFIKTNRHLDANVLSRFTLLQGSY